MWETWCGGGGGKCGAYVGGRRGVVKVNLMLRKAVQCDACLNADDAPKLSELKHAN